MGKPVSIQAFRSMKHQLSGQVPFSLISPADGCGQRPLQSFPPSPRAWCSRRDKDGPSATGSQPFSEGGWRGEPPGGSLRNSGQEYKVRRRVAEPREAVIHPRPHSKSGNIIHVWGNAVSLKVSKNEG